MKKIIILIMLLLSSCMDKMYKEAEQIVKTMTLEQKIGQMMMIGVPGKKTDEETVSLIEKYKPGGIILFGYNIAAGNDLRNFIGDLQKTAMEKYGTPLFISVDQEGGRVKRITGGITQFPGNMAFGVGGDESSVYKAARILGIQLRNTGVNINLAPVLDVNNNPLNPVINTRSFGSNVDIVKRFGNAYIKGLQESGCISVAKHFPGHGDTNKDSHLVLPVINHDLASLRRVEFPPFAEAVENGVEAVMTAHISFPDVLGNKLPATLSERFLKEILRKEMRFEGIIITDDMEMNAVSKIMDMGEAAVKSVESGGDVILVSTYGKNIELIANALKQAAGSGRLSAQRIDESVKRILELKLRYRIMRIEQGKIENAEWKYGNEDLNILKNAEELNTNVSRQAVYYYPSSQKEQDALKSDTYQKIFITSNGFFKKEIAEIFPDKLLYSFHTEKTIRKYFQKKRGRNQKQKLELENSILYYQFDNADPEKIMKFNKECRKRGMKLVLLCTGNPFLLNEVKELPPAFFTFSNTEESVRQLILCLKGEFKAREAVNVSLGFN